ncbi:MAG: UDP-3-O-(3-hydroxymyristoyl)glucosamine N-acyltransferase [bacterium]|nr:UDP-3-O-(3-hydroxymyristoyl)glucosamine N-acyltransferase [bacterium]
MKKLSVVELSKMLNAEVLGNKDIYITGVNTLGDAEEYDVSFLSNQKYYNMLDTTKAAVVLVSKDIDKEIGDGKTWLLCDSPNISFSKVVDYFAPPAPEYKPGIHSSAVIDATAIIDASCHIGPNVVIEKNVEIKQKTIILSGVFIGENSKIGRECIVYQNSVMRERTEIGNNVIIHSNVSIGADGFGYEATPFGIVKIPQVGYVKIEDEVEIGSNSTIDRGRFGKTWIKSGVKFDDQVHVAHNVIVGEFSMLIGQCGVAGSSKIGQGVIVAAQAGISHHLNIGSGAKIAGQAGVTKDIPEGGIYAGTTAEPVRQFMARTALPRTVKKLKGQIKDLESIIKELKREVDILKNK